MSGVFIEILNMSLSAGCVTLIVVLLRLLMQKAPKKYAYMLWAIVFFRFMIPFTIQLPVSVVPIAPQPIPQDIVFSETPSIQSGLSVIDNTINSAIDVTLTPANRTGSANPIQAALRTGSIIWLAGITALILYTAICYLRLQRRVRTSVRVRDNIFETDLIKTAFVLGFIHPKIYIPTGLNVQESQYIIQHEQTHITRRDYLIKPLVFLVTVTHWFNPLAWVAYVLMARDMELSADDHVMKRSAADIRSEYSNSLLTLSARQSGLLNPLAFGETGVHTRIKNVLKYKKPVFLISMAAFVTVIAASLLLLSSAASAKNDAKPVISSSSQKDSDYVLTVYINEDYSENDARVLLNQITAIENVNSAVFVSSQQAMDEFMQRVGDHPRYNDVDASWFRNRYIVYITDTVLAEQTIGDLLEVQGVVRIHIGYDTDAIVDDSESSSDQRQSFFEQQTTALSPETALPNPSIHENAPIPNLRLYSGNNTDWPSEADRIIADATGRYVISDTLTILVKCSAPPGPGAPENSLGYFTAPGQGSTLCFAEDGSDVATMYFEIPPAEGDVLTDAYIININVKELFPDGFTGQMWAVIVESPWPEQSVAEWHGKRINVVYMPQ